MPKCRLVQPVTRLTYPVGHRMFTGLFNRRHPGEVAEPAEGTRLLSE
jgi:hypothetical protein